MTHHTTRRALRLTALGCALAAAVLTTPAYAAPTPSDRTATNATREARYDLGDQAFRPPASLGYEGSSELAATVYYPADLGAGRRPVVLLQHGHWETCADAAAAAERATAERARDQARQRGDDAEAARQQAVIERAAKALWAWPCSPGTPQIPSSQGYDYLGHALAARGFVVVSVGANGLNATEGGQAPTAYQARAYLIERHLQLWQRLTNQGDGPLRTALTDARTGAPVRTDFHGRLDLNRVGLLGHSMGGGGVMQEISDDHRAAWPAGIDIKAAFALAPTATWDNDPITRTPFAVMWGTCDEVNTGNFFEQNRVASSVPLFKYTLTGGNHASYNRQWSPASGQVASRDDALPGTRPGTCRTQYPDRTTPQHDDPRLTEQRQRQLTAHRVTAFFERFLQGKTDRQPYLTGERPFPGEPARWVSSSYAAGSWPAPRAGRRADAVAMVRHAPPTSAG
ncbi:alpha/beta hydrolase [Streptomyces sp. NPDC090442]|uniref:alpha/beta hydrolase n=1 Tax=Streptomyces sp. NPDC090442 TaxID=3365962 RepID=UPI00382D9FFD